MENTMKTMGNNRNKNVGSSNNRVMLYSTKEFLREHKKAHFFSIMLKQVQDNGKMMPIPLEIQPLLKEFKEIILEEYITLN
jgi:hypothetical protein